VQKVRNNDQHYDFEITNLLIVSLTWTTQDIKGHLCKAVMWISTPFLVHPPLERVDWLPIFQIQATSEPYVDRVI
jgi:hypothetical protein